MADRRVGRRTWPPSRRSSAEKLELLEEANGEDEARAGACRTARRWKNPSATPFAWTIADRTHGIPGVLGAGVAGLFFARDAVRLVGKVVPDGVESLVPSSEWRIYTIAASMPDIAPADYRLRITGHVERPTTLTLADLRSLPRAEQVSDFHCVTGWPGCRTFAGPASVSTT